MFKSLFSGWVLAAAGVAAAVAAAGPVPPSDPAAIEAYRRLPYCRLAADGKRLAEQPCRRPPTRGFAERRAAPALPPQPWASSRPQAHEPGHEWRPTLLPRAAPATPGTPIATGRAAPPGASVQPVAPVQPLNPCGIAGCRGADGTLYLPGAGDIVLDPSGRMCTRQGQWVHCQ
jgi:hypothetical protein